MTLNRDKWSHRGGDRGDLESCFIVIRYDARQKITPYPERNKGLFEYGEGEEIRTILQLLLYQCVRVLHQLKYLQKYPQIRGVLLSIGGWG